MSETNLFLSLGDIIQLKAPDNLDINTHIYLITYIDDQKLQLIDATDIDNPAKLELTLIDGNLTDENIEEIAIVDKAAEKGFARQKGLVPETWIDIYFGGDVPYSLTGKIASLEEDMIEIVTYPALKHIFIDFAYKGIPANLPITAINIRGPPSTPSAESEEVIEETDEDAPPDLQKYIAEGDEIVFSAQEEEMIQLVDVGKGERRFAVREQSEDLLDELLAKIPTNQRTNEVMNNIHKMIARFKELRQAFSIFDEWGNPQKPLFKGANYKPLATTLQKLNYKLYWILPVVENRRKIYYGDTTDLEDVMPKTLADVRDKVYAIEQQYKQNVVPGDQNKYVFLMRSLNPYWTPIAPPIVREPTLHRQEVNANINVIVNNNEDFFSSTYGTESIPGSRKLLSLVHPTQFVLETYTLGLTYLESVRETPRITTIQRIPLTPNDSIHIKNFLTLPMSVVKYSKINLPTTSILKRANLHLVNLNYWELLRNKTKINVLPAGNRGEFLDGVQNIQMQTEDQETSEQGYKQYLSALIPKTKRIFKRIQADIVYPYSLTGILEEMEPFMVYDGDLTFQQYKRMTAFIFKNIHVLKINVVERKHESENYVDTKIHITPVQKPLIKEVSEYTLHEAPWWLYSTSEILAEMLNSDGARVLTIQLSLRDIDLFAAVDLGAVDERIHAASAQLLQEEAQDTCAKYILAKRYIDVEELEEDNNNITYFDKKYDETRYDIMEELGKLKAQMDHTAFSRHLKSHLEKLGLTTNIEREVAALLKGRREVIDGDFAMLMDDDSQMTFYKRVKNHWAPAPELKGKNWIKLFCNLQDKCLKVKETCNSENVNQLHIQKKLMEDVIHHFENENNLSRERLQQQLTKALVLYKAKLAARENLQQLELLKYDLQKYHLGLLDVESERVVSPHAELRELILMQTDFVKKQNDIKNFVARFCRIGQGEDESPYWYYDAELGVPLLPTFLKILADAFEEDRYQQVIEQIAARQGQLSDSGDAVVDKHSGYVIKQLDFVTLEEYDEKGFRVVSHDLLEQSMQDLVASQVPVRTFESPEAKMIYNVITAMSNYLSLKMESEINFIIKNVLDAQRAFPSEVAYNKAMKARRFAKTYKFAVQQNLLLLTLAFIIIVLQTMTPSIAVHKTFPGCRRSFAGFPFDGDGDDGFLQYIACIIFNTKLVGTPWKTLKVRKKKGVDRAVFTRQIRQDLVKRLKSHIIKYILPRDDIKERIREKREYLTTYAEVENIPEEHNITSWLTFLPPLRPLKLSEKRALATSFVTQLNGLIESGSLKQEEQISILLGRIIYRSLAIIQSIQRIVNKEAPILRNSLDEPFLENVCCNVGIKNTIKYFCDKEQSIRDNNDRVRGFEKTISLVRYLTMAAYLFDPADTRYIYPLLSPAFSEETIYKAFIRYCRFNSGVLLGADLKGVCIDNKSEFLITHTFEEKMAILKGEGKRYTLTHFYQLMKIVETKNIVTINLEPPVFSARPRLEALLETFSEDDIQAPLLTMLHETLEYIEIETADDGNVMGKMDRYLELSIGELQQKILAYIQNHSALAASKMAKIQNTLLNLGKWRERGEGDHMTRKEDTDAFVGSVFHRSIINIVNVYPQIIANQVDYEEAPIPEHWHLSPNHIGDVQSIIAREFADLRTFYDNKELYAILVAASKTSQYIIQLIDILPIFMKTADAPEKTSILFGADVYKKVMHFYYLTILDEIILKGGDILVTKKYNHPGQEFGKAKDKRLKKPMLTEVDIIIGGETALVDQIVAKYITRLLQHFEAEKKILNMNNEMIMERILKIREKEKNRMTKNFEDLSIRQREIEKIMMNHRLGEWSVGLTRALYVYDEDQYEKERERLEKDALEEIKQGKMGADTEMTQSIYKLDLIAEGQAEEASWKEAFDISDLPDDDDYGERDGDEAY